MDNEPNKPGEAKELTDNELEGIVGGAEACTYKKTLFVDKFVAQPFDCSVPQKFLEAEIAQATIR